MSDYVQDFTESAEKVAKMMDLINRITGKIQPVIININGLPFALTLQPIVQEAPVDVPAPVEDAPAEEEEVVEDAPVEEVVAPVQ